MGKELAAWNTPKVLSRANLPGCTQSFLALLNALTPSLKTTLSNPLKSDYNKFLQWSVAFLALCSFSFSKLFLSLDEFLGLRVFFLSIFL